MGLDPELLHEAEVAKERLAVSQYAAERARADYHQAIRRLHAAGGSLREIAEALRMSHQRVHQIIDEAAAPARWWRRRAQLLKGPPGPCSFCGRSHQECWCAASSAETAWPNDACDASPPAVALPRSFWTARGDAQMTEPLPIVLVPGLWASARLCGEQLPELWRRGPVTIADHTRDDTIAAIAGRILAATPPSFALVGLSMGGYVAFEIARQAPDRVARHPR